METSMPQYDIQKGEDTYRSLVSACLASRDPLYGIFTVDFSWCWLNCLKESKECNANNAWTRNASSEHHAGRHPLCGHKQRTSGRHFVYRRASFVSQIHLFVVLIFIFSKRGVPILEGILIEIGAVGYRKADSRIATLLRQVVGAQVANLVVWLVCMTFCCRICRQHHSCTILLCIFIWQPSRGKTSGDFCRSDDTLLWCFKLNWTKEKTAAGYEAGKGVATFITHVKDCIKRSWSDHWCFFL